MIRDRRAGDGEVDYQRRAAYGAFIDLRLPPRERITGRRKTKFDWRLLDDMQKETMLVGAGR